MFVNIKKRNEERTKKNLPRPRQGLLGVFFFQALLVVPASGAVLLVFDALPASSFVIMLWVCSHFAGHYRRSSVVLSSRSPIPSLASVLAPVPIVPWLVPSLPPARRSLHSVSVGCYLPCKQGLTAVVLGV